MEDWAQEAQPGHGPFERPGPSTVMSEDVKHDGPSIDDDDEAAQPSDGTVCRICRGEGSFEEPLFHPCRCSGSIKFVHQDCLMEWLSHSQKKYCELCKTSFRFTKLYAPDMPQSVPYRVFVHHVLRYCARHALVWARAVLAISVWLVFLPWLMRAGWSLLFSFSDSGFWMGSTPTNETESLGALGDMATSLGWISGTDTCPATPLLAPTTTPAGTAEALLLNSTLGKKTAEYILRKILEAWSGEPLQINQPEAGVSIANETTQAFPKPSSLLSDVEFFNNMTSNPTVNQIVTNTVEGQIITVLVIVCFILVILVRDYVVQQQPGFEIQMPDANRQAGNGVGELPEVPEPYDDESDASTLDDEDLNDSDVELLREAIRAHGRRRRPSHDHDDLGIEPFPPPQPEGDHAHSTTIWDDSEPEFPSAELVESAIQRAGGDFDRFEQIVAEEGHVDTAHPEVRVHLAQAFHQHLLDRLRGPESEYRPSWGAESGPSGEQAPEQNGHQDQDHVESLPPPFQSIQDQPRNRQRAHSDGPQPSLNANPLGSNNWSFSKLPTPHDQSEVEKFDFWGGRGQPSSSQNDQSEGEKFDFWGGRGKPGPSRQTEQDERPTTPPPGAQQEIGSPDSAWTSVFEDDISEVDAAMHTDLNDNHHDEPINDVLPGEQDAHVGEVMPPTPDEPEQLLNDNGMIARVVDGVQDLMFGGLDEQQVIDLAAAPADHAGVGEGWEEEFQEPHRQPPAEEAAEDPVELVDEALDEEAIEDMEDFEGIMELLGMRGPIGGLVQNAIFCAFLVCGGVMLGVFFPYNIGKISLWALAHPMRLVRMAFECLKLLQDIVISLAGFVFYFAVNIIDMVTNMFGGSIAQYILALRKSSWGLWTDAAKRVMGSLFLGLPLQLSSYDMRNFSVSSHEALMTIKSTIGSTASTIDTGIWSFLAGNITLGMVANATTQGLGAASNMSQSLTDPSFWVIDFSEIEKPLQKFTMFDQALTYWTGSDRFWAIMAGYATICTLGAIILRRGSILPRGSSLEPYEAGLIDLLQQASGVVKVIIIISIEMLVFPLYCGLLLDAALLPLFGGATFHSRISWTFRYPLTSMFVHWFVGTGYMFHFALFVSMCRKIMRPGVLYFIRDPDDPDFHPVRDVLERNLTTQLRKIMFSAFVYGALVIVCLGGVVWGLDFIMPPVLPIHYSSNEPVLEFPVDLLFYNFLMPLAVKFFKPGDALHTMYTWWFRKCARGLCLTFFLFGERKIDEEGALHLPEDSPHHQAPWYKKIFLELQRLTVVPKTWSDTFEGGDAKPSSPLSARKLLSFRLRKQNLVDTKQLTPHGKLVRAPASDRVKIPKGKKVFIEVDENNKPLAGQFTANSDQSLYNSDLYQVVYVPPHFRARVFLFILYIWLFAAVTGVSFTIAPLMLGRAIFKSLLPDHVRTNDIYAFSIGIYILGTLAYSIFHARDLVNATKTKITNARENLTRSEVTAGALYGLKLFYAYFVILIVHPLLLATLIELYVTMPLHTYLDPPTSAGTSGRHSIRVMQTWTLGLLYMNLATKFITRYHRTSRLGLALRAIFLRGYADPDVRVLTRGFLIPPLLITFIAVFFPPLSLKFWWTIFAGLEDGAVPSVVMYRMSYPIFGLIALGMRHAAVTIMTLRQWSARVRDEAYLIGERLHNFGVSGSQGEHGGQRARAHGNVVQVEG